MNTVKGMLWSVTAPVYETVEQLLPAAVLRYEHQVAWRDISLVQSHDLVVVK